MSWPLIWERGRVGADANIPTPWDHIQGKAGVIRVLKPENVERMMRDEGLSEKKNNVVLQDRTRNKELLVAGQSPAEDVNKCK